MHESGGTGGGGGRPGGGGRSCPGSTPRRLRQSHSLNRITEESPLPSPSPSPLTQSHLNNNQQIVAKTNNSKRSRSALIGRYLVVQKKVYLPLVGAWKGGPSKDINQNLGEESTPPLPPPSIHLHHDTKCCSLC